jgi:hypothetical protein
VLGHDLERPAVALTQREGRSAKTFNLGAGNLLENLDGYTKIFLERWRVQLLHENMLIAVTGNLVPTRDNHPDELRTFLGHSADHKTRRPYVKIV